ncbi:hypothetical protein Glove_109g166 [Diversispora epigaea]|uniref:Protein kinase domain-containing protein n=1 Tax=Diversispora epigaea TaxID=1348612 RepID=A0A397J654_9GLOM|nr:hypothetical protein Glove_109g166 [Diversispora epigaea]
MIFIDKRNNEFFDNNCQENFILTIYTSGDVHTRNANIDKIIQESQINNPEFSLRWIPYDNFFDIEHIADSKYYVLYSARLKNYTMCNWDYEYEYRGYVALKELKDYRYDILEFIKALESKTEWLRQIIESLHVIHENNLVHCDLHSRNVSMKGHKPDPDSSYVIIDTGLCKLSNDLTYSDNKNNNFYGSIPYISPNLQRR